LKVLVALALMLAGLAGAGIVLGQSIQYERESGSRRAAIRLAGSIAEELRALDRDMGTSIEPDAPAIRAWTTAATRCSARRQRCARRCRDGRAGRYRITIEWPVAGLGMQRLVLPVTT
jgi:Tfp pilus assembly protein PilV